MSKIKLCIDFGSNSTVIYRVGKGIVLSEPNKILCENLNGDIIVKEFGQKAAMQNDNQFIVSPVVEGEIVDEKYAILLLRNFIRKVVSDKPKASIEAYFSVPCGISSESKQKYYSIAYTAGVGSITLVATPIADLLGCGIGFDDFQNCAIVDIGSGCTDIAVLDKNGIVDGITVNIGSVNIDYSLSMQIQSKFGVKISLDSVIALKEQIGSLLPNGTKNLSFTGTELKTKLQKTIKITSIDIIEPLREHYSVVSDLVTSLIASQEIVIINNIRSQGVIFCGNGSKIECLKEFMQQKLNMPIFVASGERSVFGLAKIAEKKVSLKNLF